MDSSGCNNSFCNNYILLKPEKATIFDLICILFSSKLDGRKFVECPQGTEAPFQSRWAIFLSISLQLFMLCLSKPLGIFGSYFEFTLNLLAMNGDFIGLAINFLRGKVIVPCECSACYASVIAFVDKRLDLDQNIKHCDCRYHLALSMMAAKLAYENGKFSEATVKNHWKMDFIGSYDFWNVYQEKANTQAFLFRDQTDDSDVIVVAFRGTEPFNGDDWLTDFDLSWYELPNVGKVHAGFMKALGLQKCSGWPKDIDQSQPAVAYYSIRETLRDLLQKSEKAKFIVTGHSLGGALAILFPAILILHEETFLLQRLECIYTFGQPRVGDENFGEFMTDKLAKNNNGYYRVVYCNDIIPRMLPDNSAFKFKHFGKCIYSNSLYRTKIVEEVPNQNYFSPLYCIPKILNAYWELMRSYVIGIALGEEFEEGRLLRLLRVVGLIIPGIPNHIPQDYVNATRLGCVKAQLAIQG